MGQERLAALEMAEIAASSDPLPRRGEQVLAVLRRVVPFDSAWPALVDPRHPDYTTLVDADLAESTRAFLAGPIHARELELAGTTRPKPPQSPSDLPFPAAELAELGRLPDSRGLPRGARRRTVRTRRSAHRLSRGPVGERASS
jgi:hypothetical protein